MNQTATLRTYQAIGRALQSISKNAAKRFARGRSLLLSPILPPDQQGHVRFKIDLSVLGLYPLPAQVGFEDICCATFADHVGTALVRIEHERFRQVRAAAGRREPCGEYRHAGFSLRLDDFSRTLQFVFHESLLDHIDRPFAACSTGRTARRDPAGPTDGWMRDLPEFLKRAIAAEEQPAPAPAPPPVPPPPHRTPIPLSLQKRMNLFPYKPGDN